MKNTDLNYNLSNDFVTIEEYIKLLKKTLNNKSFSNTPFKKGTQPYLSFIKKLKDYEVPLIRKPNGLYLVSKDTIAPLIDKLLNEITIQNKPSYTLKKSEFTIEDLNNFISMSDISKDIINKYTGALLYDKITYNIPSICIPFIHKTMKFFPEKDVLTYLKKEVASGNIQKIQDDNTSEESHIIEDYEFINDHTNENKIRINNTNIIKNTNRIKNTNESIEPINYEDFNHEDWIDIESVLEILKEKLTPVFYTNPIKPTTLRLNIINKYKNIRYISRPIFRVNLNDIDTLIDIFIDNMEVVNVSPKDDCLNCINYKISKDDLSRELIKNHYVNTDYIIKTFDDEPIWATLKVRVPHIKTNIVNNGVLFRKEVIDYIKHIQDNGLTLQNASEILSKKLDVEITKIVVFNTMKNNQIQIYKNIPGFTTSAVILKEDFNKLEEILTEKNRYKNFDDLQSVMKEYMDANSNLSDKKLKNTLKWFDKYIWHLNDSIRDDYLTSKFNTCSAVYDLIREHLDKELLDYSDEEISTLFEDLSPLYPDSTIKRFRYFFNFLMESTNQPLRKRFVKSPEYNEVPPYDLHSYFGVLGNIINFVSNKKSLLNKTIDVRGARTSAGSLLYILSHYTACWRATDIRKQLPSPNLRLIGFKDAKSFIEWYKVDGNEFTEDMGRIICTDIEYQIKATRATASKNNGKLLLYTSKFLYSIYGLVACICEYNREKSKGATLIPSLPTHDIGTWVDRLDPEILEPLGGTFGNRRANKSFATYISEKSEEWNLGVGYLMASVARGHKLDRFSYNEVTKVYIDKDVNEVSFLAFSSGTFSGAKYNFLDLLDDDFKNKDMLEKSRCSKEFPMTNYEIEITLETIAKRKAEIDAFFKKYLHSKKTKRETLRQLMYGKYSYGKHEGVKCILRAYESLKNDDVFDMSKGIQKPCIFLSDDGCIGCPLMIAEKYFLYEIQERLNIALNNLTSSKSKFDKMIHLGRIRDLFFPIIHEAIKELGESYVTSIVDVKKMTKIYQQENKAIASKKPRIT